jgi:hypothetical protein
MSQTSVRGPTRERQERHCAVRPYAMRPAPSSKTARGCPVCTAGGRGTPRPLAYLSRAGDHNRCQPSAQGHTDATSVGLP